MNIENINNSFNTLTLQNKDTFSKVQTEENTYIIINYIDKKYLDKIPKFISNKRIIKQRKISINVELLDLTCIILDHYSIYNSLLQLYKLKHIKIYLYYFDYIDNEKCIYIHCIKDKSIYDNFNNNFYT